MKLDELLNITNEYKTQKENEKELYKSKLDELREYQKKTEERKDNIRNNLFPEKICNMLAIYNTTIDNSITIRINNDTILLYICVDTICFYFTKKNKYFNICKLNEYSVIYDWWKNDIYREYMYKRSERLKLDNELCDIIESNIEHIYTSIAKNIEENRSKERQKNINLYSDIEKNLEKKI